MVIENLVLRLHIIFRIVKLCLHLTVFNAVVSWKNKLKKQVYFFMSAIKWAVDIQMRNAAIVVKPVRREGQTQFYIVQT